MFEAQRELPVQIESPSWLEPNLNESLAGYARRLAERVEPGLPFFLGGASFGGMLALEMAQHLRPEGVLLLSSCRSPSVLPCLHRFGAGAAPLIPGAFVSLMMRFRAPIRRAFGVCDAQHSDLLIQMMRDIPFSFVRWGLAALMAWPGAAELAAPICHIHGACDRVIPLRCVRPDVVIAGAGHLANVTHAEQVNAAIMVFLEQHALLESHT
jgi:pimeloyl-ACP methyl ester carboxylesterase